MAKFKVPVEAKHDHPESAEPKVNAAPAIPSTVSPFNKPEFLF